MKQLLLALLLTAGAFAQCPTGCITIPAQQVPVTINGNTVQVTIPAQEVPLPASSSLPAGLTWTPASGSTPAVLTVAGNVSAAALIMTNGPTLPASANGLYLWQAQTSGMLTPVPYVPFTLPPLTISQAPAPAVNTFTVTP